MIKIFIFINFYFISGVAKTRDLGHFYHYPADNTKVVFFNFIFTDFALKIGKYLSHFVTLIRMTDRFLIFTFVFVTGALRLRFTTIAG